jgi:RNA polymerase sigma factor (sigma-70 family)
MNDTIPITNKKLEEMYYAHTSRLRARARHLLHQFQDCNELAEELLQEMWLRVMQCGVLKNDANVYGWLYTIISHLALDYLRGQKRHAEIAPMVSIDQPNQYEEYYSDILPANSNDEPETYLLGQEVVADVYAQLTERERIILTLLLDGATPTTIITNHFKMDRSTFHRHVLPAIRKKTLAALAA